MQIVSQERCNKLNRPGYQKKDTKETYCGRGDGPIQIFKGDLIHFSLFLFQGISGILTAWFSWFDLIIGTP